jgi:hypothetical protein
MGYSRNIFDTRHTYGTMEDTMDKPFALLILKINTKSPNYYYY